MITSFALSQESNLIDFLPSTCDYNENTERIRNRISEIYLQNDTLFVSVGFVANCGYEDNPIADAIIKNDTLYLSFGYKYVIEDTLVENGDSVFIISFSEYECDCCFEFQYLVRNVNSDTIPVKLNDKLITFHLEKYMTYPIRFEVFKGDTINLVDKYGFRQGLWLIFNDDHRLMMERNYLYDSIKNGTDYRYHENGIISRKLEWKDNEHLNYYEYDESGNLIAKKKSPFED